MEVHQKMVVACIITPQVKKTRTFGVMTNDLLEMCDWLTGQGVTRVAMESTGVYGKPVSNLREVPNLKILPVNAQHVKAVRHGLLQASYVPDRSQRELRESVRYRRSMTQERARVVNRV